MKVQVTITGNGTSESFETDLVDGLTKPICDGVYILAEAMNAEFRSEVERSLGYLTDSGLTGQVEVDHNFGSWGKPLDVTVSVVPVAMMADLIEAEPDVDPKDYFVGTIKRSSIEQLIEKLTDDYSHVVLVDGELDNVAEELRTVGLCEMWLAALDTIGVKPTTPITTLQDLREAAERFVGPLDDQTTFWGTPVGLSVANILTDHADYGLSSSAIAAILGVESSSMSNYIRRGYVNRNEDDAISVRSALDYRDNRNRKSKTPANRK